MPNRTAKPTSLDIAQRAKVSQATVSRALRDSPLVRPETRALIKEIAREIGYHIDHNAAGLRTRRSHTLALLLFEESAGEARINPFFLSMLGHIAQTAARRKFDLLVSFQQSSDDWHGDYEVSNRADGLILLGYGDYVNYAGGLQRLAESGAHFVIWGPVVEGQPGHCVTTDNAHGGRLATEHLLSLGRSRIAFAGVASEHYPEFRDRHAGYVQALRANRRKVDQRLCVDALSEEADGYQAGLELLARKARFDAVFAASDLIALGLIRALQDRGLSVPGDVAVVGFDDLLAASYSNPRLTTIRQDTRIAGELLVENLIQLIEDVPVETLPLLPTLIVRESCGCRLKPA